MKKVLCLLIVMVGVFGFIGFVNAEEDWTSIGSEVGFIGDLIEGEDLSDNQELTDFLATYDVYYRYVKIEDSLYQNYLSDTFKGTSLGAEDSIMAYIPTVNSTDDLSSWIKVSDGNLAFADLEYDETQDTGYIVGVAAVNKEDTSKIYVYRGIFEVSSSSTLVDAYNAHYAEYENGTTTTTTTTTTTGETVATESNPNTGISDYAYILVPIALVGGSILMFKKRYA